MKQLYAERRMDGDAMRNAAQTLDSFLQQAIPYDSGVSSGVGELPSWVKR